MEDALTDLIRESTKSRQELDRQIKEQIKEQRAVEDVFFETCALRMKKLPATMKSFLQLQITQLFLNAENPQLPQIPITPLPTQQPQINAYCGPSAAHGSHPQGGFFEQNESLNPNTQSGLNVIYSTAQVNNSTQGIVHDKGSGDLVCTALNLANMMS